MPAVALVTLLQTLPTAALALAGAVLLAVLGRLPPRWCLTRLGLVVLIIAPFLVLLPFVRQEDVPTWQLGPITVSQAGLYAAGLLACKTMALVLLMLVLLATAPLPDTFKAAQRLRAPGLLVQLAVLTYRYVFVLGGELSRIRVALRVRGYRNRVSLHSYRTAGHVAGALLVRGFERADRVGQAMRCRGFDGRFRSLNDFRTELADLLLFTMILGGAVALLAWDVWRR
jgi:cobalt/nickel transport system permease protein